MKIRGFAGVASFVMTLLLIVTATQLNANPDKDKQPLNKSSALNIVKKHFKPSVINTEAPNEGIILGRGVTVELVPVQVKRGYATDVIFRRAEHGNGVATAKVELNCFAESYRTRGRVARPVQVQYGKRDVIAQLRPGQSVTQRVVFKHKTAFPHTATARLHLRSGDLVVKDAVYLASSNTAQVRRTKRGMMNVVPAQNRQQQLMPL